MLSLDEQKRALRGRVRSLLPAPGSAEQISASVAAQERLASSQLAAEAQVIALYRALPSECGTASLAAALQAAGKEICYPVVLPGRRELEFRRGVGVFVPPSSAEPAASRFPRLLGALEHLDRVAARPLALLGDHVLCDFERTTVSA